MCQSCLWRRSIVQLHREAPLRIGRHLYISHFERMLGCNEGCSHFFPICMLLWTAVSCLKALRDLPSPASLIANDDIWCAELQKLFVETLPRTFMCPCYIDSINNRLKHWKTPQIETFKDVMTFDQAQFQCKTRRTQAVEDWGDLLREILL